MKRLIGLARGAGRGGEAWAERSPALVASQLRQASSTYPLTFVITVAVTISLCVAVRDSNLLSDVLAAAALHLTISLGVLARWFHERRRDWLFDDPGISCACWSYRPRRCRSAGSPSCSSPASAPPPNSSR